MNKALIILAIFCILNLDCSAYIMLYTESPKDIDISGTILDLEDSDEGVIEFKLLQEEYMLSDDIGETKKVLLKNGRFNLRIDNLLNTCYIKFSYRAKAKKFNYPYYILMTAGDSIKLNIEKDKIYFSGRGSEKLNCQLEMNKNMQVANKVFYKIDYAYFEYLSNRLDTVYRSKINILNEYRNGLNSKIYELLLKDCIGKKHLALLFALKMSLSNDTSYLNAARQFYKKHYQENNAQIEDSKAAVESLAYTNFLFEKEYLRLALFSKDPLLNFPARLLYNNIKETYRGALRDKLLSQCILFFFNTQENGHQFLDDALSVIEDIKYRSVLIDLKNKKSPGAQAYNFQLKDTANNIVRLSDFRGKVVFVDFWFTGCSGCIKLTKQLYPIIDIYKDNPNIQFIGINVDNDKSTWIKSIYSGKYSSPITLNLQTNGEGVNHPLLNYYSFSAFPQLLLIDKSGKLISINPPKPYEEESKNRLINLIEEHLKD